MARFERSLKVPMGIQHPGGRATSSFASITPQRYQQSLRTMGSRSGAGELHSFTGRAGPGFYNPVIEDFSSYEGPPAFPGTRQPLRQLPMSAALRRGDTRFVSAAPRFVPNAGAARDVIGVPGPGTYPHETYSQFHIAALPGRCQPFAVMQTDRTSIRDVYPDPRCGIICKPRSTPAPNAYAPVPSLDRLRMSMPNPPLGTGRIRSMSGRTLDAMLRSSANLSSTLKDIAPSPLSGSLPRFPRTR